MGDSAGSGDEIGTAGLPGRASSNFRLKAARNYFAIMYRRIINRILCMQLAKPLSAEMYSAWLGARRKSGLLDCRASASWPVLNDCQQQVCTAIEENLRRELRPITGCFLQPGRAMRY